MDNHPTPAELIEAARRKMPHIRILEANEKSSHRLAAMILAGISIAAEQGDLHVMMGIPPALKALAKDRKQRQRALAWAKTAPPEVAALTEIMLKRPRKVVSE